MEREELGKRGRKRENRVGELREVKRKEARSGNKLTGNKTGRERILRKEHYITCTFFNSDFK